MSETQIPTADQNIMVGVGNAPGTSVEDDTAGNAAGASSPDSNGSSPPVPDTDTPLVTEDQQDPPQASEKEIPKNEISELERVALAIVKAEAIQAYRREDMVNPAEKALGKLGRYLSSPTVPTTTVGEPFRYTVEDGKNIGGVFQKNQPLPRLKRSNDDAKWNPAYDNRATPDDEEPTPLGANEVQLDTFMGRTPDGLYHVTGVDANGPYGRDIPMSEYDFIKAFMVAQAAELTKGLEPDAPDPTQSSGLRQPSVRLVLANMIGACGKFAEAYGTEDEIQLNLMAGNDRQSVEAALKEGRVGVSRQAGLSLATNMIEYNKKNLYNLSSEKLSDVEKRLVNIQSEIESGLQPSAEQMCQILILVGEPGLREELSVAEATISSIEQRLRQSLPEDERKKLEEELTIAKDEKASLTKILTSSKNNPLYHLFEDAQSGAMNPDLVALLNGKLENLTDPKGFFELKKEDLEDESSLISLLIKHSAKKSGKDPDKVKSWLSEFFRLHKGDISLMLIYALIQTASGVFTTAIKNT